jgi:hypothetical protein
MTASAMVVARLGLAGERKIRSQRRRAEGERRRQPDGAPPGQFAGRWLFAFGHRACLPVASAPFGSSAARALLYRAASPP